MAGRYNERKGQEVLVQAAALLMASDSSLDYVVIGGAPRAYRAFRDHVHGLAEDLGVAERFTFVDHLPREALMTYLEAADVIVMPSQYPEGGGLAAIEGMALGKPVIASDLGAPPEYITHMQNGILIRPDAIALAGAIHQLAGDADLRTRLGDNARRTVALRFEFTTWIAALESIYGECSRRH